MSTYLNPCCSKRKFDYITENMKDEYISERTFDFEFMQADLFYDYTLSKVLIQESEEFHRSMYETDEFLYLMEGSNDTKKVTSGNLKDALKNMVNAIIDMFGRLFDKISHGFKRFFGIIDSKAKEKQISADELLNTDQFKLMVNMDYNKKLQELEAKMTEGERLSYRISSATGIDPGTIDGYIRSANELIKSIPDIAVTAGKVGATSAGLFLINGKNRKEVMNSIQKRVSTVQGKFKKFVNKVTGKPEEKKVVVAMKDLSSKYNRIVNGLSSKLCSFGNTVKEGAKFVSDVARGEGKGVSTSIASAAMNVSLKDAYGVSKKDIRKSNREYRKKK